MGTSNVDPDHRVITRLYFAETCAVPILLAVYYIYKLQVKYSQDLNVYWSYIIVINLVMLMTCLWIAP